MTKHNATTLIHGHTHRPKVHSLDGYTRIVLGDWETSGSYVVLNKDGFELKTFSIGAN
jgi:UDP-2,3-diacylglucosamine hydrolase